MSDTDEEDNLLDIAWLHGAASRDVEVRTLSARVKQLEDALKEIVDFCDDPNGSEYWESLALGLSRLLPAARAALNEGEG